MNRFGQCYRLSIFGESHGNCIGVVIDGCPAGLLLDKKDFEADLKRRKSDKKGSTQRREADSPMINSGVLDQKTTGAPITIVFSNKDARVDDYIPIQSHPRPGHADFVSFRKYGGFQDFRGGGHFSGRMTIALVAAGAVAKKLIAPVKVSAGILEIGGSTDFEKVLDEAVNDSDSLGGIIECSVTGLPVGLGEPFFDSVESLISHIIFAIPGVKGLEFGSGFACSRMKGSLCNDEFIDKEGRTETNHSGGINGGITNGNEVLFRVAVRPTPSIGREQTTVNLKTGKREKITVKGRHDTCFALRVPVIVEAAAAIVFADLMLRAQIIPRIWRVKK